MIYIKALHIIFVVTWFAGLFYIVRLFIYLTEALDKPDHEKNILIPQYQLMANRLWFGITWPSAIITLILGSTLLYLNFIRFDAYPIWILVKLGFLILLYAYHYYCHIIFIKLRKGEKTLSSNQLRIFNEVATVFLFAIVFLAVIKSAISMVYGLVGLTVLIAVLMIAIRIYKKKREV